MSKGKREKSKEKMWCLFCLVNVRRFFAQRNSPFDMGDFSVLAPRALAGGFAVAAQPSFRKLRFLQRISRRTRVRLRVAVLQKSPHLKRLRSAIGANKRRRWHYRDRSTGRLVALHSLRHFVSAPPAAIIAESASPCFVARVRFRLTRT